MNVIKQLGEFNYGDIINTHATAPFTGNYDFKYEICSVQRHLIQAFTAGQELTFPNMLNENVNCQFIIKFPVLYQTGSTYYVTTSDGRMVFSYNNVIST